MIPTPNTLSVRLERLEVKGCSRVRKRQIEGIMDCGKRCKEKGHRECSNYIDSVSTLAAFLASLMC